MKLKINNKHFFERNNSIDTLNEYKKATKKLKKEVNVARKAYEKSLANKIKFSSKPFHSYISNHTKYKSQVGPLKVQSKENNKESMLIDKDGDIANVINETLGSVFIKDESITNLPATRKLEYMSPLTSATFYTYQVENVIKNLKPATAPGPDSIRAKFIIELKVEIAPILT